MRKKGRWILPISISIIIVIAVVAYYVYTRSKSEIVQTSQRVKYGKCRSSMPSPIIDSNFIKVDVSLKGPSLSISDFEWNDSNYASNPGCFRTNQSQTEHNLSNFMYKSKMDSIANFYIKIRTKSNNNEGDFSIQAHNLQGQLIGKYPNSGESVKIKLDFIGNAAIIDKTIKLKN